jgi:mRNA interferase YafQ
MTFEVKATGQFRKDYKVMQKRGAKMELLHDIIALLQQGVPLPERYRDHPLSGTYTGHRECHIKPDWLLVYYYPTGRMPVPPVFAMPSFKFLSAGGVFAKVDPVSFPHSRIRALFLRIRAFFHFPSSTRSQAGRSGQE